MTAKTFTWSLDLDGFSGDFEQAISAIKFGDGYEQRRTSNINSKVQKWTVQKTGKAAALAPIKAFLEGVWAVLNLSFGHQKTTRRYPSLSMEVVTKRHQKGLVFISCHGHLGRFLNEYSRHFIRFQSRRKRRAV